MRQTPLVQRTVAVILLCTGWMMPSLCADTPDAKRVAESLDVFFKLGLPDVSKAKWVRAQGWAMRYGEWLPMSRAQRAPYSGNAWLVSEHEDGTVELVTQGAVRIRGRVSKGDRDGRNPVTSLPEFEISPADLAKDLKQLEGVISGEKKEQPAEDDEAEDSFHFDSSDPFSGSSGGTLLLFFAQLQHHGESDFVRKNLPMVLSLVRNPEAAINDAITSIARSRMSALGQKWPQKRDANAYATAVENLCREFSRGWQDRPAALLFVNRLREQKPSPAANDEKVAKAAEFLLNLPPDFSPQSLGRGNWLLPIGKPPESDDDALEPPDAVGPKKPGDKEAENRIQQFLANRREALSALAALLDDHRFTAVFRESEPSYSFYSSDTEPDDDRAKRLYAQLARPAEVGELALQLLEPVLPGELRSNFREENQSAAIAEWVQRAVQMSDEQLAWDYMKGARNSTEHDFLGSLTFLIDTGTEETQRKLREVFLDPGVWNENAVEMLIPPLQAYLKKLNGERAEFGAQVIAAAKTSFSQEKDAIPDYYTGAAREERKKQLEKEYASALKSVELAVKSQSLEELLKELAASDEADAEGVVRAIAGAMKNVPFAEAEPLLFRAAADSKFLSVKSSLFTLLHNFGGEEARGDHPPAAAGKLPTDAETRVAIEALLEDQTILPNERQSMYDTETTVGETAAMTMIWPRLNEDEQTKAYPLSLTHPALMLQWARASITALMHDQERIPVPDRSRVPAPECDAIISELAALPAEKVVAAFEPKTFDQRLAVAEQLAASKTPAPPSIAAAHLTIRSVLVETGEDVPQMDLAKWKGRRMDQKLKEEIDAAADEIAMNGKAALITLRSNGPMGGLVVSIRANPRRVSANELPSFRLPGLGGKPLPEGIVVVTIQNGPQMQSSSPVSWQPVWKDMELTKKWRAENSKPLSEGPKAPDGQYQVRSDPVRVQKSFGALATGAPESWTFFRILWFSSSISNDLSEH